MRAILIVLSLLLISGCRAQPSYSFFDEHEKAFSTYMGANETKAKETLIAFLKNSEDNWEKVLGEKRLNPTRVMAMEYLHLANIYRFEGNAPEFDRAVRNAIRYLDRDPAIAGDSQYREDKIRAALRILDEPEKTNPPKWRQTSASK